MFDLGALAAAIAAHGAVARVVIAGHKGSSPREDGVAMLVWGTGQSGTIGGGALEHLAVCEARRMLAGGASTPVLSRHPLGPGLGQCCGGVVDLVTEVWDQSRLAALSGEIITRPLAGQPEAQTPRLPIAIRSAMKRLRSGEAWAGGPLIAGGWIAEPVSAARVPVWIWGAGHVGRALISVLQPFPDFSLTWIDTARARFPDTLPDGVTPVWTEAPAELVPHAPPGAEHLIVTFSHALDLELCHRLLTTPAGGIGLIGSATKWARFRSRLRALGHAEAEFSRITSPIGDMSLGKHPQAIAVGVAVQLLKRKRESGQVGGKQRPEDQMERKGGTGG